MQKLKSGLKEICQPEVMLSKAYHVVYTHQDEHALSHGAALYLFVSASIGIDKGSASYAIGAISDHTHP